ncbi:hypothetical protein [Denitromonas iodatirespirans]|uniref:Uncharacterized protein n=1 Tax=Denitromonas iodatirespirans TaxID=2795389 RepID=A0A944H997_DENI1|nr:hypothetical protein [Denitromonas iodatirespirans]MBT0963024.1 hypothetical protein [Denitromonas iodatirespirans]
MTTHPSSAWFDVFPSPRIPDVLAYVFDTWGSLQREFAEAVSFSHDETVLTDNLCEALEDRERRLTKRMDCDFQAETWELRRDADGRTTRVARADIRVILGAPGTPHLVIEFKKLDGSADSRWRYCFDGMNRFVEGKYAQGHAFGVMCAFSPNNLDTEASALAAYIDQTDYRSRLCCIADAAGQVVIRPSQSDPTWARFDTNHGRPRVASGEPIRLLHTLIPCAAPATPAVSVTRSRHRRGAT